MADLHGLTYNKNEKTGSYYEPVTDNVTRQPQHLLKLWSTYDLGKGGAGAYDWLAPSPSRWVSTGNRRRMRRVRLAHSSTHPIHAVLSACAAGANIPYSYTQDSYGVLSARLAYGLSQN